MEFGSNSDAPPDTLPEQSASVSPYTADQYIVTRTVVDGLELLSVSCDGHRDALRVHRRLNPALDACARVAMLLTLFGAMGLGWPFIHGMTGWPRTLIGSAIALSGLGAGFAIMRFTLSGLNVAVHEESTSGPIFVQFTESRTVPWRTAAISVSDANGIPVGTLTMARGMKPIWKCTDASSRDLWSISFDSVGQVGGLATLSAIFGHGPSLQETATATFAVKTADGHQRGQCVYNEPDRWCVTLDLSSDPDFTIDRRLAVALAVRMSIATPF